MLRAVLFVTVATVAMAQELDFFAKHVNPVTAIVQKKWGNATTKFSVIEIDACRFDPSVVVRNSGCLSYDPMDKLSDIGYLRVLYTPGQPTHDQCGPSVEAHLDVTHGNHTLQFREPPGGDVLGDVCTPIGLNNKTRLTVDEAFSMAQTKTGGFKFFTINFRDILYPCVSEPTHVFTTDASNPADPGGIFVGVDSQHVCKTAVTRMYTLPNGSIPALCQKPDRLPDCYP